MSIGGILSSVINPTNLAMAAMGPSGWAAIAMRAIMSQVIQQVVQQVGQQLNLPQGVIDSAKESIPGALGLPSRGAPTAREAVESFGEQTNASRTDTAFADRVIQQQTKMLTDAIKQATSEISGEGKKKAGKGQGSWLQVLADAMTRVVDTSLRKVDQKSTALADLQEAGGKIKSDNREGIAKNQAMSTKAQQDFSVATQEFNIISNAVTTAIKTIGEALTAMSRKQ